jgi:hypothetical protein
MFMELSQWKFSERRFEKFEMTRIRSPLIVFQQDLKNKPVKPSGPDGWRVVDDDYGQAVGKIQAESMMSTAASLFP